MFFNVKIATAADPFRIIFCVIKRPVYRYLEPLGYNLLHLSFKSERGALKDKIPSFHGKRRH